MGRRSSADIKDDYESYGVSRDELKETQRYKGMKGRRYFTSLIAQISREWTPTVVTLRHLDGMDLIKAQAHLEPGGKGEYIFLIHKQIVNLLPDLLIGHCLTE